MRTTPIQSPTGVAIRELPQWVHDVNVVWFMSGIPQNLQVFSSELIGPGYGFQVPVGPVDVIVKETDGKHMGNRAARKHYVTMASLQVRESFKMTA